MKPNQIHIRANRDDGTIWFTYEKPGQRIKPVRDVTQEILLALCADLSANSDTATTIERSVEFSDGMICKITVHMERKPT